jgi:hypothetical protein
MQACLTPSRSRCSRSRPEPVRAGSLPCWSWSRSSSSACCCGSRPPAERASCRLWSLPKAPSGRPYAGSWPTAGSWIKAGTAHTPVVQGAWFHPGLHVNAVGAPPRPDHREIDTEAVRRSRLIVDTVHTAIHESGATAIPLATGELTLDQIDIELGDVIIGRRVGRRDPDDITLFNSVGLPIQDFATARLVVDAAHRRGIGQHIDLAGANRDSGNLASLAP